MKKFIFAFFLLSSCEMIHKADISGDFQKFDENVAPKIILTEVRTEGRPFKDGKNEKAEFLEFRALEDCSLSDICVKIAFSRINISNTNIFEYDYCYQFPDCRVKKDEIFVLHLRGATPRCIDETGDDLTLATENDSSSARDFWWQQTDKILRKTAVVLLERKGKILDAIAMRESENSSLSNVFLETFSRLKNENAWQGEPFCLNYSGESRMMSVSRQNMESPNCAENWIFADSATPGFENSSSPYVAPLF